MWDTLLTRTLNPKLPKPWSNFFQDRSVYILYTIYIIIIIILIIIIIIIITIIIITIIIIIIINLIYIYICSIVEVIDLESKGRLRLQAWLPLVDFFFFKMNSAFMQNKEYTMNSHGLGSLR